ncbi:MAG TPA: hypothetical protein DCW31_10745 [Lactobacillus sp.]|nr:hypothetical protein [Lactobacillus sp.]
MITSDKTSFDQYKGQTISKFSLINSHGTRISVLDFGATWFEYTLHRVDDTFQNVLLNEPDIAHYLNNPFYLGATIGRVAGRIGNGRFQLDGKTFLLQQNEGTTTLHGGPNGFAYQNWTGKIVTDAQGDDSLQFSLTATQTMDSFPGTMHVTTTYTLDENDQVTIVYEATSDKDTLFSPTCHAYFNLNRDQQNVRNHQIKSNAETVEALDERHVPNGILSPLQKDMYDYHDFVSVGDAIDAIISAHQGAGIDDTFSTPNGSDVFIRDDQTHLVLRTTGDRNGVTIFTANGFNANMQTNKGVGRPFLGLAVEPHILSNAINLKGLGNMVLKANTTQRYSAHYHVYEEGGATQ